MYETVDSFWKIADAMRKQGQPEMEDATEEVVLGAWDTYEGAMQRWEPDAVRSTLDVFDRVGGVMRAEILPEMERAVNGVTDAILDTWDRGLVKFEWQGVAGVKDAFGTIREQIRRQAAMVPNVGMGWTMPEVSKVPVAPEGPMIGGRPGEAWTVGGQRVNIFGGLTLEGVQSARGLLEELERLR